MERPSSNRRRLLWGGIFLAAGLGLWWAGRPDPDRQRRTESPSLPASGQSPVLPEPSPPPGSPRKEGTPEQRNPPPEPPPPDAATAALIEKMNASLEEPDLDTRTARWNALLAGMRPRDVKSVRAIFQENDRRGRWFVPEWIAFWKKYGEMSAVAALDEWKATGDPRDIDSPGQLVAAAVRARGLPEAEMLMTREDVRASPLMMREVMRAVARQAPGQSLKFMMESVPADFRNQAAQAVAEVSIDRGGLEQATALMQSLVAAGAGEDPQQAAFSVLIAAAWRGGPDRAQEFALAQMSQPWCTGAALGSVSAQLMGQDPEAAMDFIIRLPEALAGESIEMAVDHSARLNPDELGAWLKEHASIPYYDRITSAYCRALSGIDPLSAEAWAQTIRDPVLRDRALAMEDE